MQLKPKSLMIGYVHNGMVHEPFMGSMLDFILQDQVDRGIYWKCATGAGSYIDVNRLAVVYKRFMPETRAEVLLFIDTDIFFRKEQVYRLIDSLDPVERPIVSGLYFGYVGDQPSVPMPIWFDQERNDQFPVVREIHPGLQKLGAVGMGFCAIHRSVFEKIPMGTAFERMLRDTDSQERRWNYGEDMAFCLRATEAGIPIYGDAAVVVGHIKSTMHDFKSFVRYWSITDPNGPQTEAAKPVVNGKTGDNFGQHNLDA